MWSTLVERPGAAPVLTLVTIGWEALFQREKRPQWGRFSSPAEGPWGRLPEEAEDRLGLGVGLGQDRHARLLQDLGLGEVDHL